MDNTEKQMILEVQNNSDMGCWLIVNKFDGVIVGREYTMSKALKFAREHEAAEQQRIRNEYPDVA